MSSSKKQAPLSERDGNLLVAASNQLPQDDEEQEVVVVEKYSPASRARSPIEDCTVDQIVVTVGETNPIKKPKKNQPDSSEVCTRLKCIGSVSIQKLSLDHLRSFCSKIKMRRKHIRSLKKPEICQLLVERKCKYDQDVADGKPDSVLQEQKAPPPPMQVATTPVSKANMFRAVNVLYSETMRQEHDTRARCLNKSQLDNKEKTGDTYYTSFMNNFNDSTMFNDDNHSHIEKYSYPSPDKFDKISSKKDARSIVQALFNAYEVCLSNQTVSGQHCAFQDLLFETNKGLSKKRDLMLYIHCSEQECPGTKNKVVGSLPNGPRESHGASISLSTPRSINRGRRNTKTPPNENTEEQRLFKKQKYQNQIHLSSVVERIELKQSKKALKTLEQEHRRSVLKIRKRIKKSNPLLKSSSVKKMAAKRIATYEKMKTAAVDNGEEDIYGSDVEIPSSQESLFEKCYKQKAELENDQLEIKKAEANLKQMQESAEELSNHLVETTTGTIGPQPKRGTGGKPVVATKQYYKRK